MVPTYPWESTPRPRSNRVSTTSSHTSVMLCHALAHVYDEATVVDLGAVCVSHSTILSPEEIPGCLQSVEASACRGAEAGR